MTSKGFVLALLLAMAPAMVSAKIYYINKGVKYHLGDGHAVKSTDADFIDAYPVVGPQWAQAFSVDREDTVRVRINNIWGVDDCPYCKDIIYIDDPDRGVHDHALGRLYHEDNHHEFGTRQPLSIHVMPGHVYILRIVSMGSPGPVDDFAIEGVSVETDAGEIKLMGPPVILQADVPVPRYVPPKIETTCGARDVGAWIPEEFKSQAFFNLGEGKPNGDERPAAVNLGPGEFMQIWAKLASPGEGDSVSQSLEVVLGPDMSGWVFLFAPASGAPNHGNMKLAGRYSAPTFSVQGWKNGDWNDLRVARCPDGKGRLFLNGVPLGQMLDLGSQAPATVNLKSVGLVVRMAEKPF